jgi:MHS family proline/betaine transporter-like MFS transporter
MLSRISTFAVFAIGFFMRPLGAILFGHFGDKHGRKNALSSAILLMAIPTTLIGCLPSVEIIGLWAPFLLILFRLLQGLAVGGEYTGSIVYIVEHAPNNQRGYFGSLAMSSAFVGLFIGSVSALIVYRYFNDVSYAWRIPFLFSLILGGVGLYLRLGMPESPVFKRYILKQKARIAPIKIILRDYKCQVLKAIALVMLPSAGFYMSFVYLPNFLRFHLNIPLSDALMENTVTMLLVIVCIPFFGALSDSVGRKAILLSGSILFFILSPFMYLLLLKSNTGIIYFVLSVFAFLVAISYACIPATLVEMFKTDSRYTGMSLPYNIANALFGGTAPLVATSLIYLTGKLYTPGIYLSVLAFICFMVTFYLSETRHVALLEMND